MKNALFSCVVMLCAGFVNTSAPAAEPTAKPDLAGALIGNLLRGLDADKDGTLGVSEAVKSVEKLAKDMDADGNGVLSDDELRSGGQKVGAAMRERAGEARHAIEQRAKARRADISGDIEKRLQEIGSDLEKLVGHLSKEVEAELEELPTTDDVQRAVDKAVTDARQQVTQRVDRLQSRLRNMDCPVAERISAAVIEAMDVDKDGEVAQSEIDEIVGNVFGITDSDADGSLSAKEVEGAIQASLDLAADQARQQIRQGVDRLAKMLRPR